MINIEQKERERVLLKVAKSTYKRIKSSTRFNETRDKVLKQIIESNSPNWGSIKLTVTPRGI